MERRTVSESAGRRVNRMLSQAEERKEVLLCKVLNFVLRLILHMGHDQLRNGISGIERSKRRRQKNWDSLEVKSADLWLKEYAASSLSTTGEDMICHEEFPIYSKGTGVVCVDPVPIPTTILIFDF